MSEWSSVKICGTEITPGKEYIINADIARLHTRTPVDMPIIVNRAKNPGPTVLITAGIHGDEINGVEIIRKLIREKKHKPTAGMIICIPVINVFGFLNHDRYFPDGRDLNRSFPGSNKGPLAGRFAKYILDKICPHVDIIIDLHTGGASRFNYPQIRYNPEDERALELANVFGTKIIVPSTTRDKSFRQAATAIGKSVMMFEGGKSMSISTEVTAIAEKGILNVLYYLGLKKGTPEMNDPPLKISKSQWIRAKHSGMFKPLVQNGGFVAKGDVVGLVTDPFGQFEHKVKASNEGYVFCVNEYPIVNQGDAIIHLATNWSV